MSFQNTEHKPLLVVEDDEDDLFFLMWALRKGSAMPQSHRAINGEEAIAYLTSCMQTAGSGFPTLVLLDLKMPGINGYEVLTWIRAQRSLDGLVVYVLSGSPLDADRIHAQQLGANGYWEKPSALPEYVRLGDNIRALLDHAPIPA